MFAPMLPLPIGSEECSHSGSRFTIGPEFPGWLFLSHTFLPRSELGRSNHTVYRLCAARVIKESADSRLRAIRIFFMVGKRLRVGMVFKYIVF